MAAKIYFWDSNKDEWGHLSLQLSDGTYISHWPNESKSKLNLYSVQARQMRNLGYDTFAEGRDPDETIELCDEMLNESNVSNYWNECKSTTAPTYHAVTNNCARVVLKCIEIGLEGKYKSAKAWEEAEEKFRKRILMIGATGGVDGDITSMVADMNAARTTPSDILELVKYWKEAFHTKDINQSDDRLCVMM